MANLTMANSRQITLHVKTIFEGAEEDGDSVAETELPGILAFRNFAQFYLTYSLISPFTLPSSACYPLENFQDRPIWYRSKCIHKSEQIHQSELLQLSWRTYMAVRGASAGPFFIYKNGHPLTKSKFNYKIKKALQEIGLPYERFFCHSFRIGAATTAAKAGTDDSVIQMMSRWRNSAFLLYVHTPREQLQ